MKNTYKLTKKDTKEIRQAIIDYYGRRVGVTYEIQELDGKNIDQWDGNFVKVSEANGHSLSRLEGDIPQELSIYMSHYEYGLLDTCYVFKSPYGWSCSEQSGEGIEFIDESLISA